jgi:hypothetical protein
VNRRGQRVFLKDEMDRGHPGDWPSVTLRVALAAGSTVELVHRSISLAAHSPGRGGLWITDPTTTRALCGHDADEL